VSDNNNSSVLNATGIIGDGFQLTRRELFAIVTMKELLRNEDYIENVMQRSGTAIPQIARSLSRDSITITDELIRQLDQPKEDPGVDR